MSSSNAERRGFLKRLGLAVLGGVALPSLTRPVRAGWSHRRGYYGGGLYRGGYPGMYGGYGRGYGGYYGGYGGYNYLAPGGYGGYAPFYNGGGYYGTPYVRPYAPVIPNYGGGGYYNNFYIPPVLKRDDRKGIDALSLLEC